MHIPICRGLSPGWTQDTIKVKETEQAEDTSEQVLPITTVIVQGDLQLF